MTDEAVSPLRRRMIEDMTIRKFAPKTQHDYVQRVKNFAAFLGRSPDTASFEDVRRYSRSTAKQDKVCDRDRIDYISLRAARLPAARNNKKAVESWPRNHLDPISFMARTSLPRPFISGRSASVPRATALKVFSIG